LALVLVLEAMERLFILQSLQDYYAATRSCMSDKLTSNIVFLHCTG